MQPSIISQIGHRDVTAPVLKPEWKAFGKVTTKEPSSWTRR